MNNPQIFNAGDIALDVVKHAPDAIIVADRQGTVRVWNPGAERVFGFSAAEAVGRSLDLIIPEKYRNAHWAGWRRMLQVGSSRYGAADLLSVPGQHSDGRRLSLEFSVFPIQDAVGEIIGIGTILRDVTQRFEEEKVLKRRLAELEAARWAGNA